MAWERGYYYRVRRVDGRVVREYMGAGRKAEKAAESDLAAREVLARDRAAIREEKARLDALDAEVKALGEPVEQLLHAELQVAGFHRHHRGEWRRKRGKQERAGRE